MRNLKINLSLIALAFLSFKAAAQQDPAFTQYMYNMSIINPAYATGEVGVLDMGGMYRSQWVGIEGAPQTTTIFAHTPLQENLEVGLSIVHDEIGNRVKENNIFADVAYVLQVSEETRLSFGVKAGITLFDTNFQGMELGSGDAGSDIAFSENINEAFPNLGIGAYFYADNYYVGLSAPNLLRSKHLSTDDGRIALGAEEVHYFLTAGYVYDLNAEFTLKPAFMLRAIPNAPLSLDLTANVRYIEKFEAGLGYRINNSFMGLVNFAIAPELKIGYAYDHNFNNLGRFNSGSHEIMLLVNFDILKKQEDEEKRFF